MAAKNVSDQRAVKYSSIGVKRREIPQTGPLFCDFAHLAVEIATAAVLN